MKRTLALRIRVAAIATTLALPGCAVTPAIPPDEATRLATDADCRAATPGNRLPYFRCTGDYDSFD